MNYAVEAIERAFGAAEGVLADTYRQRQDPRRARAVLQSVALCDLRSEARGLRAPLPVADRPKWDATVYRGLN